MTINVELLERVKTHILEEPRRLLMQGWMLASKEAPCGTVGCIAGWSLALEKGVKIADERGLVYRNGRRVADPHGAGMKVLGLTEDQADDLFYVVNWPNDMSRRYVAGDQNAKATVTAERIDRFIAEHAAQ